MARRLRCLPLVLVCMLQTPSWAEDRLAVTLEPNQLEISVDFAGIELKAAGTMDGPGDLIIKVSGPQQEARLSREVEFGPFWIRGETVKMAGAPSLVFLYATRPIAAIVSPAERKKLGLLLEDLPVAIEPQAPAPAAEDWRKAFFRLKANAGHYREDSGTIRVFDNRAFTVGIRLPSDLQPGTYSVETLLVKSGKAAGRNVRDFNVRLAGIERWIWNAAHAHAWLFGILFTLAAVMLGFVLNAISYRAR